MTRDQVERLIEAVAVKEQPSLKGCLSVEVDYRSGRLFEARGNTTSVRLAFHTKPTHPQFREILQRAINASMQIRHGVTSAGAISGLRHRQEVH